MDFVAMVTALAKAAGAFLGFQSKKLDLKNTAAMEAGAAAAAEQKANDQAASAIAAENTEAVRNDLAE